MTDFLEVELPENSVPYVQILVTGYFNEEGEGKFCVGTKGNANLSSMLGLMEMAKFNLLVDNQ